MAGLPGIATTKQMGDAEPLGLAQLRDQLALLQYIQGDLARAENSARASLEWAQKSFQDDAPITAMCQLRLGSILVGLRTPHRLEHHDSNPQALVACPVNCSCHGHMLTVDQSQ